VSANDQETEGFDSNNDGCSEHERTGGDSDDEGELEGTENPKKKNGDRRVMRQVWEQKKRPWELHRR